MFRRDKAPGPVRAPSEERGSVPCGRFNSRPHAAQERAEVHGVEEEAVGPIPEPPEVGVVHERDDLPVLDRVGFDRQGRLPSATRGPCTRGTPVSVRARRWSSGLSGRAGRPGPGGRPRPPGRRSYRFYIWSRIFNKIGPFSTESCILPGGRGAAAPVVPYLHSNRAQRIAIGSAVQVPSMLQSAPIESVGAVSATGDVT